MAPKTSHQARLAARQEADRLVLAEVKAVSEERQARSAALKELRLAKEAKDLAADKPETGKAKKRRKSTA